MNLSILARCGLFRGIETAELSPLLRRLHAFTREFDKFQPIYRVGDTAHALCILLSGGVNIERCDAWGHKTLLDRITPGSVFAETYACVPGTPMMVSAVADEPSEVLFLPSETLLSSAAQDSAHSVLLRNLLDVTAQKNLLLTRKSSTQVRNPCVASCCRTCPRRRCSTARTRSTFRSTVNSWPTTSAWSAVRCPPS